MPRGSKQTLYPSAIHSTRCRHFASSTCKNPIDLANIGRDARGRVLRRGERPDTRLSYIRNGGQTALALRVWIVCDKLDNKPIERPSPFNKPTKSTIFEFCAQPNYELLHRRMGVCTHIFIEPPYQQVSITLKSFKKQPQLDLPTSSPTVKTNHQCGI